LKGEQSIERQSLYSSPSHHYPGMWAIISVCRHARIFSCVTRSFMCSDLQARLHGTDQHLQSISRRPQVGLGELEKKGGGIWDELICPCTKSNDRPEEGRLLGCDELWLL
jgi:hypothetical protein